jgi:DNA mismatch repair protein MutS2
MFPSIRVTIRADVRKKDYYSPEPAANELWLRHLTVDEILPKLDRFLHDTYLAGFAQGRIIHGKGTGTLRETVRRVVKKHPLVQSFRPGGRADGGEGVTVVDFTDK